MKDEHSDAAILNDVVAALKLNNVRAEIIGARDKGSDASLVIDAAGVKRRFTAEVTRRLTRAEVGAVIAYMRAAEPRVLVAPYISGPVGDDLRAHRMNFADAAGNVSIRAPGLLICVSGRRPHTPPQRHNRDRAFRPAGLRILLALLSRLDLVNATYREIATAAGSALGSIPHVLESLRDLGYLIDIRGQRRLANREPLVREWAQAYARVMLDREILGTFAIPEANWWRSVAVEKDASLWGGDVAANLLVGHLVPAKFVIYSPDVPRAIIAQSRLRKDPSGTVVIRRKYWRFEHPVQKEHRVVPPLLVYSELLANGDARSMDAAKHIYDRYIARSIIDG